MSGAVQSGPPPSWAEVPRGNVVPLGVQPFALLV